jgi:GntR family transcriptional repressor for pyruvate dehydrogenase complex
MYQGPAAGGCAASVLEGGSEEEPRVAVPTETWDGARAAVFAPVERTGRVESVVVRLADAIASGVLQDGERLPSETDLAAQLGVSTMSLRDALTALREQGFVETRRGRSGGTFVRVPDDAVERHLEARLGEVSLDGLREAQDHWGALAGAAARLAAVRAGPADVARLHGALEMFARATSVADVRRADRIVHLEIAAASHSVRLTRAEVAFQAELGGVLWIGSDAATRATAAREHAGIVQAIRDGEDELARRRAEAHLATAMARLRAVRLSRVRAASTRTRRA